MLSHRPSPTLEGKGSGPVVGESPGPFGPRILDPLNTGDVNPDWVPRQGKFLPETRHNRTQPKEQAFLIVLWACV